MVVVVVVAVVVFSRALSPATKYINKQVVSVCVCIFFSLSLSLCACVCVRRFGCSGCLIKHNGA